MPTLAYVRPLQPAIVNCRFLSPSLAYTRPSHQFFGNKKSPLFKTAGLKIFCKIFFLIWLVFTQMRLPFSHELSVIAEKPFKR